MGFLNNVLGFEAFNGKRMGKALLDDPSRLLTGVDPASTWAWNGLLGTHKHPIVDQMGGATGETYKAASDSGINTHDGRMMQNLAHVVAGVFAAGGLAGAGGGGAGAAGEAGAGSGAVDGGSVNLFADAIPGAGGDVGASSIPGALGTSSGFGGVGMDQAATGLDGASIDPALAGDNIDAGGGWNPGSGGSGSINYQQLLGKALNQMGQQKQQQGQGGGRMYPVNTQPGNVPYNFMGGM
jgi:hypothetical protein